MSDETKELQAEMMGEEGGVSQSLVVEASCGGWQLGRKGQLHQIALSRVIGDGKSSWGRRSMTTGEGITKSER